MPQQLHSWVGSVSLLMLEKHVATTAGAHWGGKVISRAANMRFVIQRTSEERHRRSAKQDVWHTRTQRAGVFHCSFPSCQGAWPHMIRTSAYTECELQSSSKMCIYHIKYMEIWRLANKTDFPIKECWSENQKCAYSSISCLKCVLRPSACCKGIISVDIIQLLSFSEAIVLSSKITEILGYFPKSSL